MRCVQCQLPFHQHCIDNVTNASAWTCSRCESSSHPSQAPVVAQASEKMREDSPITLIHYNNLLSQLETLTAAVQACTSGIENNNLLILSQAAEIGSCRHEIEALKTENSVLRARVESLENKTEKTLPVQEIRKRLEREPNLIVSGIQEDPQQDMLSICRDLFRPIIDNPEQDIVSARRIGGLSQNRSRLVQVILSRPGLKYHVLKHKSNLNTTRYPRCKVFNDLTPMQSEQLRSLRSELSVRQGRGETGVTIKYIEGEPRIVENWQRQATTHPGNLANTEHDPTTAEATGNSKRHRSQDSTPEQPLKNSRIHPN